MLKSASSGGNDTRKTKAQLIAELAGVRQRVSQLEAAEAARQQLDADRQQLDAALRASETRYRRLFETAQDGILLLDAATGQITDVNPFLVKMLGYSPAEFVGKHLWEVGPFKDVAESKLAFEQLQRDEYIRDEDLPLETRAGRRVQVEFVSNVYRVNGNKVIQCNVRDITERKQLEMEIQDAREYAENIVETVHEPLVVLNSDLKILTANHSFYDTFKVSPEETIGNFIYDLGNRQWDISNLRVLFEEILPHDTVFNGYEVEHDFLNIGRKIILLNARQIFRENIGSHIILLAMEDITERKRAEEALQQRTAQLEAANKELETFAYSVSHDLRAPLRGIDGWSLALLEDYGQQLDAQARQYLDRVRSETQRMAQLIDDLLQLSRVVRTDLQPVTVNLSALAQTITARLQAAQPAREFEFIIQPGLSAHGDAHLLGIALTNLLDNAAKFTGPRPVARIEFGQTEVKGQPAYFIRDNGVGFDLAYARNLFGAFQRMHRQSEFPGTGIGLATVQRIIHRHGGRVWAEAAVDQGATFYFTLEAAV